MSNSNNDAFGRLKKELPWIQSLHFTAHLLNLGLVDSYKEHQILVDTNKVIFKLCSFFNSRRSNNLKIFKEDQEEEYNKLLEDEQTEQQNQFTPKNIRLPVDTRWLSILFFFNRERGFLNQEKIQGAQIKDLLMQMTDFKFILFLLQYQDILEEVNYFLKHLERIKYEFVIKQYICCIEWIIKIEIRNIKYFEEKLLLFEHSIQDGKVKKIYKYSIRFLHMRNDK